MAKNGPFRWHGGKSYLAKRIHELAPRGYTHRNYPYAGGLGELWGWEYRGISEAVNDKNSLLTNFWKCLADPTAFKKLKSTLERTPFAEQVWKEACKRRQIILDDPDWRAAVAFFVCNRQSRQGLGKDYATPTRRIRRGMNENVSAWWSAVEGLDVWYERFHRIEVRCMDAVKFIQKYDHKKALFYCDPPYLHSTRSSTGEYELEMTPKQHRELLDYLANIDGKFILSGYKSKMYLRAERKNGWNRVEILIDNKSSSSKKKEKRTEVLWTNY